jgi:hypothetical protein
MPVAAVASASSQRKMMRERDVARGLRRHLIMATVCDHTSALVSNIQRFFATVSQHWRVLDQARLIFGFGT